MNIVQYKENLENRIAETSLIRGVIDFSNKEFTSNSNNIPCLRSTGAVPAEYEHSMGIGKSNKLTD